MNIPNTYFTCSQIGELFIQHLQDTLTFFAIYHVQNISRFLSPNVQFILKIRKKVFLEPRRLIPKPTGSMYGVYTYIYHKNQPNVGKYTIHGSYGKCPSFPNKTGLFSLRSWWIGWQERWKDAVHGDVAVEFKGAKPPTPSSRKEIVLIDNKKTSVYCTCHVCKYIHIYYVDKKILMYVTYNKINIYI